MNVASILKWKGRNVLTCKPTDTMLGVAQILAKHRIGCIVLVDDENSVAGIVSERDIVRAIAKSGSDVLDEPVSQCMTKEVITCRESDTINSLMSEMTSRRFRHLPVVEGGELVGLVSIGDVVKERIAEAEMEAAAMREYIAAG
ncbi:inosine-5'-monophosphate dehydrogenase [bacterium MnTg02]|nr:inosine-5'-monophosphate dehydrogenase [bacterium MnTg02]